MADDDDDVRGAPGPEELLAPSGPRRSNFTPAPTDAESLEAANNVFNDDAIAAALAAELARVASGPIPIQQSAPASAPPPLPAPVPAEPAVAPAEPATGLAASPPEPVAASPAGSASEPVEAESVIPAPVAAAPVSPVVPPTPPLGPPDWATPLFGQPTTPVEGIIATSIDDPFAPNAPSFAPATGSFPPPVDLPGSPTASMPSGSDSTATDVDALRETYRGAPAPTVPAADAPPPPGYDPAAPPSIDPFAPGGDVRPRRRSLDDDELLRSVPEGSNPSDTLNAIEQLQAQLHLREQEAREFATWQSAMQAIGTPEALAEVERARAELSGAANVVPQEVPPPPPAVPQVPPPGLQPMADLAPPVDEPAFDLAPPTDEPLVTLLPPDEEPIASLAPPSDEPFAAFPAPPAAEENPFDAFARMADERLGNEATAESPTELTPFEANPAEQPPPPPAQEAPFTGFAPPAIPEAPGAPDAPAFLEPPALVEPPAPSDTSTVPPPPVGEVPIQPPAVETPVSAAPEPAAPTGAPRGFDDLLAGSGSPNPPAPAGAWTADSPPPAPEAANDSDPGRRPFGEGVERDDAVDPTDSVFGAQPSPVTVNTAGVAVVPEKVGLDSRPIRVQTVPAPDLAAAPLVLKRPSIVPAEPVGLEPTALEQRVGRSARLFWLWFAANSSIATIVLGTIIFALGVSLRQAIVATLAGVALSFVPLGLGTLAGKRSGQPTMVISRATFGVVGNIVPAILSLLSRLFWAAALLWILGAASAEILIGAGLADRFSDTQLTLIAIALFFVIAVVIAFFGYAFIAVAQLVVSVISAITIIGFIALTARYVNLSTALSTADGPWTLVVTGAVLVFSFVGLAWANTGADLARYQRPGSSGAASMLSSTFGAALPSFVLIGYGALLAASNHALAVKVAADPLDALGRLLPLWYPVPLLAGTGLSLLSGVVLAMYSGGFALQSAGLRLTRSLSTLFVGVLVIVIAIVISLSAVDFSQLIRDFSTTVAVPIAAWVGIFGAEVMMRKRPLESQSLLARGGRYADVRWGNLITLVGVTVIGYGFLSATAPGLTWEGYGFEAFGIPLTSPVATSDFGVLVALVLGLLLSALVGASAIRTQEKTDLG